MDMKSLIARMDDIENKQVVTESVTTEETTKEIINESVEVSTVGTKKLGSIASLLMKDLGYGELAEAEQPGFLDRVKGAIAKGQADQAQQEKELAAADDPAAQAAARDNLTPSQLKWLGGANPADPFIRARMPKPQPGELTAAQQKEKDQQAAQDKELDAASAEMDALKQQAAQDKELDAASAEMDALQKQQQAATPKPDDQTKQREMNLMKGALEKLKAALAASPAGQAMAKDTATAGALPKNIEKFESKLSESEIIANLRKQLEAIDSRKDQEVDEIVGALARGAAALGKGAMNIGKNFASGLKGGSTVQQVGKAGQFGKVAPGGKAANVAGKAIAANPGKTALATGVAGAGLGYGLSDKPDAAQQAATPAPAAPAAPAAGGKKSDPEVAKLQKELNDKYNAGLTVDGIMGPKTQAAKDKFMGGQGQAATPAPAAGGAPTAQIKDLAAQVQSYKDSLSTMAGDPEVDALIKQADELLAKVV